MLADPIVVSIIPSNDNNPEIAVTTTQVTYVESAAPVTVFPDVALADNDQTCTDNMISYAVVTIETPADVINDRLQVKTTCIILLYLFACISTMCVLLLF